MYTAQAVDLINGVVKGFECSTAPGEIPLAHRLVAGLEKNSITLYDRYYDSYATASAHENMGNYFLARVKINNPGQHLAIQAFCRSNRRSIWLDIPAPKKQRVTQPPLRIRLIKVKN